MWEIGLGETPVECILFHSGHYRAQPRTVRDTDVRRLKTRYGQLSPPAPAPTTPGYPGRSASTWHKPSRSLTRSWPTSATQRMASRSGRRTRAWIARAESSLGSSSVSLRTIATESSPCRNALPWTRRLRSPHEPGPPCLLLLCRLPDGRRLRHLQPIRRKLRFDHWFTRGLGPYAYAARPSTVHC